MTEQEWIEQLKKEGMTNVTVVHLEPNFTPGEHTHKDKTAHIILQGELTTNDANGEKRYKVDDRIDFPAGTRHSVVFGPKGCRMIVGILK